MRESSIVRKIIDAVRKKYPRAYAIKLADRFNRGRPDVVISLPCVNEEYQGVGSSEICKTLYVEAKTIYGRTGALQVVESNKITTSMAHHIFARSPEAVLNELEAMGAVER